MKQLDNLQAYVASAVKKHQVPAISLAVWHNNKRYKGASGVLNTSTGVEATTDSIFQIGSISKVFTTSLVMQLVDEGRIELDNPVKDYIRDFHVACPEATATITVRQLLCHTSGLAGDLFPYEDEADSNLARYLDRCYLLPQVHPPGAMFSYSNSACCVAGRLVEVMTGLSWFEAVEERIIQPLGMRQTAIRPTETLRFRAAMGHELNPQNNPPWQPGSKCYFPLSMSSVGSVLSMTASDLIDFALPHINAGLTPAGEQWLSAEATQLMQQPEVQLPTHTPIWGTGFGLGWALVNQEGSAFMFGHDGGTVGQCSMLRIIPEQNLIVAALMNADDSLLLGDIFAELLKELTGITYSDPVISQDTVHPERYCGQYESLGACFTIVFEQGELFAKSQSKILGGPPQTLHLKPIGDDSFMVFSETGRRQHDLQFLKPDNTGRSAYLFYFGRLCPRVC